MLGSKHKYPCAISPDTYEIWAFLRNLPIHYPPKLSKLCLITPIYFMVNWFLLICNSGIRGHYNNILLQWLFSNKKIKCHLNKQSLFISKNQTHQIDCPSTVIWNYLFTLSLLATVLRNLSYYPNKLVDYFYSLRILYILLLTNYFPSSNSSFTPSLSILFHCLSQKNTSKKYGSKFVLVKIQNDWAWDLPWSVVSIPIVTP